MGRINWGRVILGGLLAGVIINIVEALCGAVILKSRWDAAANALGITMPQDATANTIWVLFGFAVGIWAVWLYAAIRPRYGAGVKTALCAGFATWFLGYLLWSVSLHNMGLFPGSVLVPATAIGLVELLVATVAGAWLYKE
jgi:hypothetical protein